MVAGTLAPNGILSFGFTVFFTNGVLGIHATDSTTVDRIEAAGAVSGSATVRMTRAETAFPTQQVVYKLVEYEIGGGVQEYGPYDAVMQARMAKPSVRALPTEGMATARGGIQQKNGPANAGPLEVRRTRLRPVRARR
jgi:hypothetical protein